MLKPKNADIKAYVKNQIIIFIVFQALQPSGAIRKDKYENQNHCREITKKQTAPAMIPFSLLVLADAISLKG
jgi:hypothetical protein